MPPAIITQAILRRLAAADKNVKVIINTRNFGHIRSPYYGMLQARGAAIVALVSDLQEPPEMIPDFLRLGKRQQDRSGPEDQERGVEAFLPPPPQLLLYRPPAGRRGTAGQRHRLRPVRSRCSTSCGGSTIPTLISAA